MAYDFLGLTNDICAKTNETPLTTSNFTTELGVYQNIKDSVNSAIRHINQSKIEWPFNHVTQEDILNEGEARYFLPTDYKTVDWSSFRIKRDSTLGNSTQYLDSYPYEEYLREYIDDEYNSSDTSVRNIPSKVFRTPSDEYALNPVPNKEYTVVYEYYRNQVDLINATDVPSVPETFRYIIIDGAMYYLENFRGSPEQGDRYLQKFIMGIENMQRIYITRYNRVTDTRI